MGLWVPVVVEGSTTGSEVLRQDHPPWPGPGDLRLGGYIGEVWRNDSANWPVCSTTPGDTYSSRCSAIARRGGERIGE
ncbi:hypothetical protein CCUG62472_04703 [Mycobacteroides salmoniphilum]|nr:hypothetical protein CCUG62472_04703 [Mycobacteroides salmoniphilum]